MRRYLISLSSTTDRSLRKAWYDRMTSLNEAANLAELALITYRDERPPDENWDTWTVAEPGGAKMLPRIVASGQIKAE